MDDGFIDLTVTSPPYDNLRDYKGYSFDFESIAKELYRVTKIGGVVVWVAGDATINGSETGTSFKQALYFKEMGFNLHDTMIYEKSNFSNPMTTRYHQIFEYMFILSKGNPSSFNPLMDHKNSTGGDKLWGKSTFREKNGKLTQRKARKINEFGMRRNIWRYMIGTSEQNTEPDKFKHPATFPDNIARDHIYTWSNKGDLIYDPFMGSGTTAKMAHLQDRNWIGSEMSAEYVELANKRIKPYLDQLKIF